MTFFRYSRLVFCCLGVPRKSRSGPRQAQTEPQTRPCLSSSRFTCAGSMCDGSSMGISMVSKPHCLNCLNSLVLSFVNGEVKRKVLMPSLIIEAEASSSGERVKAFCAAPASNSHSVRPVERAPPCAPLDGWLRTTGAHGVARPTFRVLQPAGLRTRRTASWACSPTRKAACATSPVSTLTNSACCPPASAVFIQTVQQINGWRDLPPNHLRPHPHPVGQAPAKASTNPPVSSPSLGCARPGRAMSPSTPPLLPL